MNLSRQKGIQRHFNILYFSGLRPWEKHYINPSLYNFFKFLKKKNQKPKILDIGCGNGWISMLAAKEGIEVWGIDSSKRAIKEAKEKTKKEGLEKLTHFETGDALSLPYQDNFFNGLIDRGLFHHILPENRKLYFKNISRVLKKGSLVYLSVFSKRNPKWIGQIFTFKLVQELFGKNFKLVLRSEDPYPYKTFAHLLYFVLERKTKT